MRNASLFAFTPALIAIGFGVWAAPPANAPVSPSIGQGIEPFKLMVNAKELPSSPGGRGANAVPLAIPALRHLCLGIISGVWRPRAL